MDRLELIRSARSSYNDAQNDIIDLTKELQRNNNSVSLKQNLLAFDGLLQLIMLNVAARDGIFLKAEKDFITQLCDYGDIMQMAGYSWDAFLRLDSAGLKNVVSTVNTKVMDLLSATFSPYYELGYDKIIDLEANVSNICHCLACIDGDTRDTKDYIYEWGAGMELFDKAFKQRALCIAPTKPVFYGFDKEYQTKDITIRVEEANFDCDDETLELIFYITNKQHRNLRVWLKDLAIWAENTDQETSDGYKLLAEIDGYDENEYVYTIQDSMFNDLFLAPSCVDDNPYDIDKCCSELAFRIAYDFGDSDVDVSTWVLESAEFEIIGAYDCFDEDDEDEENNDEYRGGSSSYTDGDLDTSSWNIESILRQEGYTVSQREGLSDSERQAILLRVIENKKMSKYQVIEHIELQIGLRKNNSMYDIAISKWKRDIAFLNNI